MSALLNLCSLIESETIPPLVRIPPPSIAMTRLAPNRLLSFNRMKELIEPVLSHCPVCKYTSRRLKDGYIDGLDRLLFIECAIYASKDLEFQYLIKHLSKVLLLNLSIADKKRIRNQITKKKTKLVILRKSRVGRIKDDERVHETVDEKYINYHTCHAGIVLFGNRSRRCR